MTTDRYQQITDEIVALLEEVDAGEWTKPWATACGRPRNGFTGRDYHGVNTLMLWMRAQQAGFSTSEWFTFRQAKKAGGHVRKSETGTKICFFKILKRQEEDDDGEETTETFPVLKTWTVFNRDQIEGLDPVEETGEQLTEAERLEHAEHFIAHTGATIEEGTMACYVRGRDVIELPPFASFRAAERYYTTALHELAHWTSAEHRVGRKLDTRFGSYDYAVEELIAELASAFLAADLQLDHDMQEPARYLKGWIEVLKSDKYAIFTVSREAEAAAEYLHDLQPSDEADQADDEAA